MLRFSSFSRLIMAQDDDYMYVKKQKDAETVLTYKSKKLTANLFIKERRRASANIVMFLFFL